MLGSIWWDETLRGVSAPERMQLAGLNVLRVRLAPGGIWERRRVERAGRLLQNRGVCRLLPVRTEPVLPRGFSEVDPLPLYRAMAAEFALALLSRRGILPRRACVLLRGTWAYGELAAAARGLCPLVRALVIDAPGGGDLEQELYETFGAVGQSGRGDRPDVSLRFDGAPEGEELCFSSGARELGGLCLSAELSGVPETLEYDCVLAALWQAGLLLKDKIRVTAEPRRGE